jgi:hypothetical protein
MTVGEAERIVRQRLDDERRRQEAMDRAAATAEQRSQEHAAGIIEGLAREAVTLLSQQGWPGMSMVKIGTMGGWRGNKVKVEEMACRRIGDFHYTIRSDDVTAPIYLVSTGQIAYATTASQFGPNAYGASMKDFTVGFGADGASIIDGLGRLIAGLRG